MSASKADAVARAERAFLRAALREHKWLLAWKLDTDGVAWGKHNGARWEANALYARLLAARKEARRG